jgi:hypothetical protein
VRLFTIIFKKPRTSPVSPLPLPRPVRCREPGRAASGSRHWLRCPCAWEGAAAAGVLRGAWHGFAVAPGRTSSGQMLHVCWAKLDLLAWAWEFGSPVHVGAGGASKAPAGTSSFLAAAQRRRWGGAGKARRRLTGLYPLAANCSDVSRKSLPDLALVLSLVSWRCLPVTRTSASPNLRWRANAS